MACSVAELWMSCYWSNLEGMYITGWSKLAQRNCADCYSVKPSHSGLFVFPVGLSLLNVIHHTVMSG
jgi:hypothetical protein